MKFTRICYAQGVNWIYFDKKDYVSFPLSYQFGQNVREMGQNRNILEKLYHMYLIFLGRTMMTKIQENGPNQADFCKQHPMIMY